jgi:hypothetical protein
MQTVQAAVTLGRRKNRPTAELGTQTMTEARTAIRKFVRIVKKLK